MKKPTFAESIIIILTIILVILGVLQITGGQNFKVTEIPSINLTKIETDNKIFFSSLFNNSYHTQNDFISEVEIGTFPSKNTYGIGDSIEMSLKFSSMSNNENARVRAFFTDPYGLIQYEYPPNIIKNFSEDKGEIDLNKIILFKVKLIDEPSKKIDGQWLFTVLVVNNDNSIISEVIEPVQITSIKLDDTFTLILNNSFFIIAIITLLGLLFYIYRRFFQNFDGHKKIFEELMDEKISQKKSSELYVLLVLVKYVDSVKKDVKIEGEGHNTKTGEVVHFMSTKADSSFSNWITLGFARRSGDFIRITKKGKKMVKFLEDHGYILDMVNNKILTQGYIPFSKKEK
ncbi:MAG: hypothetical protein NT038_06075 [Euryarchaeota archaeon]|nr:hypothetical protein [Euryarchaeota archaeon]